jgi:hypothetical protein
MNKIIPVILLSGIISLLFSHPVFSQTEETDGNLSNQQVTVLTQYTPIITDAFRMESLPQIIDTVKINPDFTYSIYSSLQPTIFHPAALQAAKLEGEQKDHLDKGYAKLSLGNKLMLDGEIYYMNTRDKDFNWGISGKHFSSQGKIKNSLDNRVYSGINMNKIGAFGKKMHTNTVLTGSLDFSSNQYFFYGYNPNNLATNNALLPDDREDFIDSEEFQRYSVLSLRTNAKSRFPQVNKINYDVSFNYDLWLDANKNNEQTIDLSVKLKRKIKSEYVGLNTQLLLLPAKYLDPSLMYLELSPYMKHNSKNFKVKLGLKTKAQFAGDETDFHFYPDIQIEHNIADVLLPYASFSGNLNENSMLNLTRINPFIVDTLTVNPANTKQNICVGMKGRISDELQFNINGQYQKTDNQHFFVNDFTSTLQNRFNVVYSDIELYKFYAELDFDFKQNLEIRLYGTYNHYSWLKSIDHPWHIPAFKSGLYTAYNVTPQLKIHIETYVEGNRYALVPTETTGVSVKMDAIIDVNIGAEYQINNQVSAFIQFNNIACKNYEIWYQYKVYGFHVLGGIKYGF